MIIKSLLQNPLDSKQKPWKPAYGYLIVAVMLMSAGLYVYQRLHGGPVVPTSTVPAVVYQNAKDALEHQGTTTPAPSEPDEAATQAELDAVAKAALDALDAAKPAIPAPSSANLAVPFASQAPFANWDVVHEDTCEEASILMVAKYFDGATTNLEPQAADDAMLAMVDAETKAGLGASLTAAELGSFAESYFATLDAKVIEDPSIDEIKAYVQKGIPVIVPAAGRELGNPFYAGEGPLYHYFVIRGYDGDTFITNDPGTRRGENYTYSQSVIMSAMGDWNSGDPATGASRILILEPKQK
jgi:hypothetical protein